MTYFLFGGDWPVESSVSVENRAFMTRVTGTIREQKRPDHVLSRKNSTVSGSFLGHHHNGQNLMNYTHHHVRKVPGRMDVMVEDDVVCHEQSQSSTWTSSLAP